MAKRQAQTAKEEPQTPSIDAPPQAGPPHNGPSHNGPPQNGSNCSDETKRHAYREALILQIAVESAQDVAKSKLGAYRAYLKEAGKRGVSTDAIAFALQCRFEDPDLVLIEQRERLKMLDLSGFLPGIRDKLLSRMDVQEPTANEEEESQVLIAYDRGHLAGRSGHSRDENPYPPGSLGHVKFVSGWLHGQRAIADEMVPETDRVEPAIEAPQPRRAARKRSDDAMPGQIPAAVH